MSKLVRFPESKTRLPYEPDPARGIGKQIKVAHKLFERILELRIAEFGITSAQWFIIKELLEEDGLSQGELSRRVSAMANTMVAVLRPLERRGLVVRRKHPVDGRKINVFLTDEGRAMKDKVQPIAHELNAVAKGSMLNHEIRQAKALLVTIQKNLLAELTALPELKGKKGSKRPAEHHPEPARTTRHRGAR